MSEHIAPANSSLVGRSSNSFLAPEDEDGPTIEEIPDEPPEPQQNPNLAEAEETPRAKLRRVIHESILKRKKEMSLVRNLPNTLPGAKRARKLRAPIERGRPITAVQRLKTEEKLVKDLKKLSKRKLGEETEKEKINPQKRRGNKPISREELASTKAWIIDTTVGEKDQSLSWLSQVDMTAMREGVVVIKTHPEQKAQLQQIAEQWEAKFVNSKTFVKVEREGKIESSQQGSLLRRAHDTYMLFHVKVKVNDEEALSIAAGRISDVYVRGDKHGRVANLRKLINDLQTLLPTIGTVGYIGDPKAKGIKNLKVHDYNETRKGFVRCEIHQAHQVRRIEEAINQRFARAEDLSDEQVNEIDKRAKSGEKELTSIDFEATEKYEEYTPAEEVGYGDNTEDPEDEEDAVMEIVDAKLDANQELTSDMRKRLRRLVLAKVKAFGIAQSKCRMSKLDPIEVELISGHEPVRGYGRTMGQEQKIFLEKKIEDLIKIGILKRAKNPIYGSPIFVVPKKGPKKWRMVVDMRALNKITVRTALDMPFLDQQLDYIDGAKVFGTFDVLSGFDFLPTATNSQKYFTLVTKDGAYTMCGAPMGWLNTPALFQERIQSNILKPIGLLGKKVNGAIQWLDDTCLYAQDFDTYLEMLEKFLEQMIKRGVRLSIEKCELYGTEIEWCGRRINAQGWNFMTKFYEKILTVQRPVRVWEMAQVIYLCNWLAPAIPMLSQLRDKFNQFCMGKKMKKLKKENKLIEWTPELVQAWQMLLTAVRNSSEKNLKKYNPDQELLLFTDASKEYWSLVVAQDTPENLRKAIVNGKLKDVYELQPRPMMFLSGKFQANQLKWHVTSKELFPIVYAFTRLHYLLVGHPRKVHVFTDHANLEFILRPEKTTNGSHEQRHHRWALLFQAADIIVHHLAGESNFLADLLTRWGVEVEELKAQMNDPTDAQLESFIEVSEKHFGAEDALKTARRVMTRAAGKKQTDHLFEQLKRLDAGRVSFVSPLFQGQFSKLTEAEIMEAQEKDFRKKHPKKAAQKPWKLETIEGKPVVPDEILPRLILHHHVAESHPTLTEELKKLRASYHFNIPQGRLKKLVKAMENRCLHCDRRPKLVRTPLSITELAKRPGEILHSDYLYINKYGYILTLVDSLSRKTWLKYCQRATADNVVDIIKEWRAAFGLRDQFVLVTDNAAHFSNRILQKLEKQLNFAHRFSVSYSPWTNGAAERINSDILKTMKSLMSEYQLHESEWPQLISNVTFALNNKPLPTRGNLTADQIFLKDPPRKAPLYEPKHYPILNRRTGQLELPNSYLQPFTEEMRKEIDDRINKVYKFVEMSRNRNNQTVNKNRERIQFTIGDWVLVSKTGTPRANQSKLKKDWGGPMRVEDTISDNVYLVKDLDDKEYTVHAARLWFYDGRDYIPAEEVGELFHNDWGDLEVEELLRLEFKDGEYMIETKWLGFEETTWEPVTHLNQFIPESIQTFLEDGIKTGERSLYLRAQRALREHISSESGQTQVRRIHIKKYKGNPRTRMWQSEEDQVLRACMAKYGVGRYAPIQENAHLPYRTRAQLSDRTKLLLGIAALETFTGIHLDAKRVAKDNRKKYRTDYYRNLTGIRKSEEQRNLEWEKNMRKYGLDRKTIEETKVPYFRRSEDPEHIALKLKEAPAQVTEQEKEVMDMHKIELENERRTAEHYDVTFIPALLRILDSHPEWNFKKFEFPAYSTISLGTVKEMGITSLVMVSSIRDVDPREACAQATSSVGLGAPPGPQPHSIRFKAERFFIHMSRELNEQVKEIVIAERENTNFWNLTSNIHGRMPMWFYVKPKGSMPRPLTIDKESMRSIANETNNWDIIIADPPWQAAGKNPTRGVNLSYSTQSTKKILQLPWASLQRGVEKVGFLFVWVTSLSYLPVISKLTQAGYRLQEEITWLKYSKNGKLLTMPGPWMLRGKETCLLFSIGPQSTGVSTTPVMDVIACLRREVSQKPDELYDLAETMVPNGRYLELFARNHNLRRKWTSVGNQLSIELLSPKQHT